MKNKKNKKGSMMLLCLALCSFLLTLTIVISDMGVLFLDKGHLKNSSDAALMAGMGYGKKGTLVKVVVNGQVKNRKQQVSVDSNKFNSKANEIFKKNMKTNPLVNNATATFSKVDEMKNGKFTGNKVMGYSDASANPKRFWGKIGILSNKKVHVLAQDKVEVLDMKDRK